MIKQSLLDALKGAPLNLAETRCKAAGYEVHTIPHGMASIMLAFPNTIVLWLDAGNKTVAVASAGDPVEVDEES
jgi:hypothetical protein